MPDWAMNGSRFGIERPYAFWNVVDQPMLYHWFDLAHEADYDEVVFHSPNANQIKSTYFDREFFWPVKCRFTGDQPPRDKLRANYSVVAVDSLHLHGETLKCPGIWEMIDNHWTLVTERLELLWLKHHDLAPGLPIGRRSVVHPTAKLIKPYWIGNGCEIGENCTVGPFTCLGDDCRLEPGASLSNTHAGPGTVVGEDITLSSHFVEEGILFNRNKRIWHKSTDPLILAHTPGFSPPSLRY